MKAEKEIEFLVVTMKDGAAIIIKLSQQEWERLKKTQQG